MATQAPRSLPMAEAAEATGETGPKEPQATQGGRAAPGPGDFEALAASIQAFLSGPGADLPPEHLEPLRQAAATLEAIAAQLREAEALLLDQITAIEADAAIAWLQVEGVLIRQAAEGCGIRWHDLDVALRCVDLSAVTVRGDHTVEGLQEQLEALAKSRPYLVKTAPARESVSLPPIREPAPPRRRSIASSGATITVAESMGSGILGRMSATARARFERRREQLLRQARSGDPKALAELKQLRETTEGQS